MTRVFITIAGCALLLGACQSSSSSSGSAPASSSTVRQSVVTAPADLQLLCASEAQTQLGASDNVLPISSAQTASGSYTVTLSVDGGEATCVVREDGTIEQIARV